jgi:hypothetical protein
MSAQLTRTDTLSASDLVVLYKSNQGDYRGLPPVDLLTYLNANLTFPTSGVFTTQYAAPSATGFSVALTDGADNDTNIHLILTPVAGYAAGTLTLPVASGCVDKQEVLVNCTQSVTTLTVAANGATAVTGAPTTLAANAYFRLKYDQPTQTWYRVG